jgi:hypothetical protein
MRLLEACIISRPSSRVRALRPVLASCSFFVRMRVLGHVLACDAALPACIRCLANAATALWKAVSSVQPIAQSLLHHAFMGMTES